MRTQILKNHPRAHSLKTRELLIDGHKAEVVVTAGLIAFGRGEAFDYLIGERTSISAKKAIRAAAALLLTAHHPVISVNGNIAVLVSKQIAELTRITNTKAEVNIFYRSPKRERAINKVLKNVGVNQVLGTDIKFRTKIPEIMSDRRKVDTRGILIADVVLVPLEDGDRTETLVKMGKKVIAVDLNPFSRTAQKASVTIVDNIIRVMPLLLKQIKQLCRYKKERLQQIINHYNNQQILSESISYINRRLSQLAMKLK